MSVRATRDASKLCLILGLLALPSGPLMFPSPVVAVVENAPVFDEGVEIQELIAMPPVIF